MSYLRLCFGRGCGHSEPASYEFRCAAGPSPPELRYCGQLLLLFRIPTGIRYGTAGTYGTSTMGLQDTRAAQK